jgi:hypothetical protein
MTDACLHCVLGRALRALGPVLAARGLTVQVRPMDPLRLPAAGGVLYRRLRRLLEEAAAAADPGPFRLTVLDLPGKADVEVTVTVRRGRRGAVMRCAFPRHVAGTLEGGFVEGIVG